jgi:transcriptional regulator with GAF, ATPase, and Fis domain
MMKGVRYHISLYITVPIIFSGFSALCILAAYRLTRYYIERGLQPELPLAFWGVMLILIAFFCGLVVVKVIIDPVQKFVGKTRTLGVVRSVPTHRDTRVSSLDMQQYSVIFDQVSDLLGKVEARELFPDIIGQSKAMRMVFNQIMKVAVSDATVLLLGETGTGKELVANSIHNHSLRQDKPFVAINCAAIPAGLIESELFGHEKGAFTGATASKPGKFEAAMGGTVFLDEIGDMPMETQIKVLRALEDKQIERVGSVKPRSIDTRFITATNKNLSLLVEEGLFRQDLYYRLNAFVIKLPPLKQRREDIPLLAEYFLSKKDNGTRQISSQALQMLMSYDWPGNVRELKHAIESAALMAGDVIEPAHLPSAIIQEGWLKSTSSHNPVVVPLSLNNGLDERLRETERALIIEALTQSDGVQAKAARVLGIKERSLWHRLKKYGIDASEFKRPS